MEGVHTEGAQWGSVGFEQPHHHTLHHHSSHLSLHSVAEEQPHQLEHQGIHQHGGFGAMAQQPHQVQGYPFGYSDPMAQHSPGLMGPEQDFQMHQGGFPGLGPQWPGMASSPSTPGVGMPQHSPTYMPSVQHIQTAPTLPTMPQQPAPVTMPSTTTTHTTHTGSTARRTLTDADRRQMCLYHEENPNVKQTVIGAMFGVERSTVSKVLRQKEKYLYPDDGSRSPVKRTKGKFPDIERALSVWVRNRNHSTPLTDEMIQEKAWHFAMTTGVTEAQFKANNGPGWLEKFKQKNNITTVKSEKSISRKQSLASIKQANGARTPTSSSAEADGSVAAPAMMHTVSSDSHNTQGGSPDSYLDYGPYKHTPGSMSTTSLSSMYTDAANSSFTSGPASPASPFFPNHHSNQPSPGFPSQQSRLQPPVAMHGQHRPRSQTFPRVSLDPTSYISPPPTSTDPLTPKLMVGDAVVTPPGTIDIQNGALVSPHQTPPGTSVGLKPTKEEACEALQTLVKYLNQEPIGSICDPGEYSVVQTLLQRLSMAAPHSPNHTQTSTPAPLKTETEGVNGEATSVSAPPSGSFLALMEGTAMSGI